jgi:hypothetical protein
LLWPLALVVGGCGGDQSVVVLDAAVDAPGPQRIDDPGDFDRAACQPGALAGHSAQAIYHARLGLDGATPTVAARIDRPDAGLLMGAPATRVLTSADDLFWYQRDGETSRALDLCARDGELLRGQYALCNATDCLVAAVIARRVDRLNEADASGLVLLGSFADPMWTVGKTVNVRVDGDVAFLARGADGLRLVDLTDPAQPRALGHAPPELDREVYNDVKVVHAGGRRYAIVAGDFSGGVVWDTTDATNPRIVAHLGTPALPGMPVRVHTVFVDGARAYLANVETGLEIYDVTDPAAPARLGALTDPPGPTVYLHDLFVAGDRAYLNAWSAGLEVVDVADPAMPRPLGLFSNYGHSTSHSSWVTQIGSRRIAAHGDEEWGAHLRLVDVTEGSPAFLTQAGAWRTRDEVSIHNVVAVGDRVYAAHYQDGLRVIDISDLSSPRQVAWWNTWPGYDPAYGDSPYEGAYGVDVDPIRRRVYVADSHRGLIVLELAP